MGGKALERAATIALGDEGLVLEGIFSSSGAEDTAGAVVAPPHPLYGGSMDSPVVNEIAFACRKAGLASLRFNWRGVGASAGETSEKPDAADADYAAAAQYLEEIVPGPLVAAGYSFGALAALRAAAQRSRIRRLLLVSPPVAALDASSLAGAPSVLIVTGELDGYAPPADLETLCDAAPGARLHVIPEADHFYMRGLSDIARIAESWL